VSNRIPDYLKLHTEELPLEVRDPAAGFDQLCHAFRQATGWSLRCNYPELSSSPANSHWLEGTQGVVSVTLEPTRASADALPRERLTELVGCLDGLLKQLFDTRVAIRHREADLAAAVPVISCRDDKNHLAERLASVLQGAVEMLNCEAAGLYMLDEATTNLKLRSQWGLEERSLLKSARPLQEAVADLEALSGHAVVIDDSRKLPQWRMPEPFPSGVCVPVSTPTMILGTLWLFSRQNRDFSSREQNLIEIMAGRLAADLERHVLLREIGTTKRLRNDWQQFAEYREKTVAQITPLLEGWDLAGKVTRAESAGDFFNWHLGPQDHLGLSLVSLPDGSMQQAFTAVALRATLRAHLDHSHEVAQVAKRVNQSLWEGTIGDQHASFFHAEVTPECGAVKYAAGGNSYAFILRPHGWEPLITDRDPPWGVDDQVSYTVHRQVLVPGDTLLAFSDLTKLMPRPEANVAANRIAEKLLRHTHLSAAELATMATAMLSELATADDSPGLAVLVARREDDPALHRPLDA